MENSNSKTCAICRTAFTPENQFFIICANCRGTMSTMTIESVPLTTIVKGVKSPDQVKTKTLEDRLNSLSKYVMILQIELAKLKQEFKPSSGLKIVSRCPSDDDISDCSNSLSDFENDSDDDDDSDSESEQLFITRRKKDETIPKVYHITLNFN